RRSGSFPRRRHERVSLRIASTLISKHTLIDIMRRPSPAIVMLVLIPGTGALACCAGIAIQHDRAKQTLIAAVKDCNTAAAMSALADGASPNARDNGGMLLATYWYLRGRYAKLRGADAASYQMDEPTALLVLLGPPEGPRWGNAPVLPENVALVKL